MKEKVDKKLAFLLTFLLVVGILLIYAKLNVNFTGQVIGVIGQYTTKEACENASLNYTWNETIVQNCTPIEGCVLCEPAGCVKQPTQVLCTNLTCEENCEPANCVKNITEVLCPGGCLETCQTCEDIIIGGQCVGDICDSEHLDLCLDETACTGATGYWYNDICNAEEECTETCSSLGYECGTQTVCGESTECGDCASGYTCNVGACEAVESDNDESSESGAEVPSTTIIKSNKVAETVVSCTSDWECGDWGECVDGTQDRICTDINQCGSDEGMPETSQSCVAEIKEDCFDGIKNQDETGIDCGGLCEKKCSFFTIVGSAISTPIDAGKNFVLKGMFGNVTKTIISIASLILIIGGIIAFVLFKKGIIKFPLEKPQKKSEDTKTF